MVHNDSISGMYNNFTSTNSSIWIYIAAIGILTLILILLIFHKRKKKNMDFSDMEKADFKSLSSENEMSDLVNSIHQSKKLYIELSKHCHPDKFAGTKFFPIAEDIFQEISKNKRSYKRLIELKNIAIEKLNINL